MIIHGGELAFDEAKHMYTWNNQPVPGVTTILGCIGKPMLIPWAAKMTSEHWLREVKKGRTDYDVLFKEAKGAHTRKAKEAADAGTNVHAYAEAWFKKQPLPELLSDQAKRGVEAFHTWIQSHQIKVLASERRIFSQQYYYAGTCDFVAEIDGVLGVGDIKTSSGIYPEMRFQTAAYQHALEEEKGMKFGVRWIVRFDKKTGEFESKPFYDFDLDFQGFSSALTLHRTLQTITEEK